MKVSKSGKVDMNVFHKEVFKTAQQKINHWAKAYDAKVIKMSIPGKLTYLQNQINRRSKKIQTEDYKKGALMEGYNKGNVLGFIMLKLAEIKHEGKTENVEDRIKTELVNEIAHEYFVGLLEEEKVKLTVKV